MRKNTVGLSKKRKISDKEVFAIVIVAAFIISLVVYFTNSYITTERESVVYSKMAEPTLPVVFAVVRDDEGNTREINPMHGHYQDVKNQDVEYITPLPSSRKLEIHIKTYGRTIAGISYDIRNQKLDHYIEKTELENFDNSGDDIYATLPIQNLIDKNEKYILRIRLDIGEEVVYYYSRIYWTDSTDLIKMIDLAKGFAGKTFDEEASRELTVYMETDPHADNENYGTVTIGSSFNALTWGETGMHMATAPEVYLKECEGAMAAFEVSYLTRISDNAGTEEFYNVEEFNLRSGAERIYMMDYRRKTYEIFDGSKHRFSGKKIMLGINNREDLLTMESANGRYIVYKTNRDLWCYDQDAKDAIDIFSFRSKIDDGLRASFREHDIKILSVSDNGDVDFVVYGYMNRGLHEGYNGIVYYSYTKDNDTLTELFFIPSPKSYEKIRLEVEELCVKSDNNLFYIKQNDTVIAVEMNSLEIMEIASDLEEGTFITNDTQTCAAWIEDGKYTSRTIRTLDTKSGVNRSYQADEGEAIRPIGFIGEDMIIGRCKIGDLWKQGNRVISLPMYKLEILDKDLGLSLEYGQPGLYIENVSLTEARLLFDLYRKTDSGEFIKTDADTIVSRDEKLYDKASLVGRTTSGNKKNVYYIALTSEIKNTKKLKVRGVANISYENSGTVEIRSREDKDSLLFYAYSGGELIGRTPSFTDAVNMCYDGMGWVADKNGVVIYNRTNKGSYRKISEPFVKAQPMINRLPDFAGNVVTDDGYIILDGEGLTLNQVLVFIYKNNPVAALNRDGSYYLIYGYNQTTVELYYHQADDTSITLQMSREDFEAKFAAENSIFVCYTSLGK